MHICVLGAGIVGLATAWQLQRDGHQVTVIDRAAPGEGASAGNGAQLSYSYVAPLADPSIWRQLPHLLFSPSSPLKLRPKLDPQQWRWGLAFLAACNAPMAAASTARLLALAAASRAVFDSVRAELPADIDFSATGKLVLYRSADALEGARRQIDLQRALGSAPQRLVSNEEVIAIEPALAGYHRQIAGAVHTPSECAADCLKVCRALEQVLRARGVVFSLGADIESFDLNRGSQQGRVQAVQAAGGPVQADAFVMALGSASARFGRQLGAYLPVYPLKGYSITLDVDNSPGAAPTVNVTDSARKTVFARIGSRLRVAGMAEIVGHDSRIPEGRIDMLVAATRALFPHCSDFLELAPWTGMRPATPTGVPIIGRVDGAPDNMFFNTGHGALGFTLAFGSAAELASRLSPAAAARS